MCLYIHIDKSLFLHLLKYLVTSVHGSVFCEATDDVGLAASTNKGLL